MLLLLITNKYTVCNSEFFCDAISKVRKADSYDMVSIDVYDLFTNVPHSETFSIFSGQHFFVPRTYERFHKQKQTPLPSVKGFLSTLVA